MNEFNLTFNDVMEEIFDTGAEYTREDWNDDYNTVITEYNGEVVLYSKGSNISIGSYCISQKALNMKYKRIQKFSKKNLKSGMIVKLRNDNYLIAMKTLASTNITLYSLLSSNYSYWIDLEEYKENFKNIHNTNWDIVNVYEISDPYTLTKCLLAGTEEAIASNLIGNKYCKIHYIN